MRVPVVEDDPRMAGIPKRGLRDGNCSVELLTRTRSLLAMRTVR
jgi:hypothetical protein